MKTQTQPSFSRSVLVIALSFVFAAALATEALANTWAHSCTFQDANGNPYTLTVQCKAGENGYCKVVTDQNGNSTNHIGCEKAKSNMGSAGP